MRLTIPCPDALRADGNHFAMALGPGPAEALTYGSLNWLDACGGAGTLVAYLMVIN